MTIDFSTPWHKASLDRFLQESLPQLLAERLPLTGYHAEPTGPYACHIAVTLDSASGDVVCDFADLPYPDEDGIFEIDGERKVVIPLASTEELDTAEIACVGEQLRDYVDTRLGQAPQNGLPWDADLARAWLPLDEWVNGFMQDVSQELESSNWLTRQSHLRTIFVLDRRAAITPGQLGRVCPFETPEGPNNGRVLRVAVGAQICDGKIIVVDQRPEAGLGLTASMIPFLEYNDANRLLMGANMMRQALVPPDPEPALVQTGNEPDVPDFWTGRNLLTAFVSWGANTTWDGIVVSESAAQRLNYPYPVEMGDKLSNRYGTKGVVSQVLPDDEMPHLSDGTPVDLAFNFSGLHVRMNQGQVMEAVMGRVAQSKGEPAIVPPFHAPTRAEMHQQLAEAGLPESGMETLTLGKGGPKLERPSTVGWVYWNRLFHLAQSKVKTFLRGTFQRQGDMENHALLTIGAYESVHESLNTRASRRKDADNLASCVAAGPVEQAGPPTPMFVDLTRRLQVAGIEASLENEKLAFHFTPPEGGVLELACPVPHPWLHERELTEIGAYTTDDAHSFLPRHLVGKTSPPEAYAQVVEVNDRLTRMLQSQAPKKLVQDATNQLKARVNAFFDTLLTPGHLLLGERQLFSARTVIVPGVDLRLDQVGLADEIAWALFGPLAIRELGGDEEAVNARDEQAMQALDAVMARSWVVINRAPTLSPTALIAFHPLRDPGNAIRIHPLVCEWLNADFDGDQVAVALPITEITQQEAGDKLSVAGHLARDPELITTLRPPPEALWGLATLGLTEEGQREITQMVGEEVTAPQGLITQTTLAEAVQQVLHRDGIDAALTALERLTQRGFEVVKALGASMSPFIGESLHRPPAPEEGEADLWAVYRDELLESILSHADYENPDFGPQLTAIKIRARGRESLCTLLGPKQYTDFEDQPVIVRHGVAEGLTVEEVYAVAADARRGVAQWAAKWDMIGQEAHAARGPSGRLTVLARACRAKHPGIVFARAAATGEVDPLTDVESRALVGLPVKT